MSDLNELLPLMWKGTLVTIQIAVLSIMLAIVMAGIATTLREAPYRALRWLGNVYVEVFRGTSLLVQLFWLFFVLPLPPFSIQLTPFTVAIVGLGLHYGAYGSEILRGALHSVGGGQYEAALALNMPAWVRLRRVVLPQAMINALPPATNLMIELLKGTSLVSLITLSDLTFRARQLDEATFKTAEIFGLTLLIYFVLAQIIVTVMRHFERRVSSHVAVRRVVPRAAS
ncbi:MULTISPECIES: ectoine/hydroxyectoine ABC transporter permease subunit EhuC [unclassified Caballeronia]|uniref:ectoine/hydroxyectoine ABC transporter permease subunit EhuC n=1 Tax=unclassified Caballeronia TaxID=2646786 RepID=UPI002854E819|nr:MULTISPECIES: ectoine/hydroxyectoine ABC transporter permease subunit EhuC [unclassified Caballeronia]MDR5775360.1 ectoine/hydroxyectoine ABC transporter permease subunit EhuC [Caballeronia sp. LZ002]MDR5850798.1 ectoine/hydroxyectoine ABC transporter permease subunit EhuC [Caballeronia sp. LZ003]